MINLRLRPCSIYCPMSSASPTSATRRRLIATSPVACSYFITTSPVAYAACRLILRQKDRCPAYAYRFPPTRLLLRIS